MSVRLGNWFWLWNDCRLIFTNYPNHEISALVFAIWEMIGIDSLHQHHSDSSIK